MLDNLEELLGSTPYSVDDQEKEKGPEKVRITPGALTKIKTYARLVERITGSANECYGYLLADKDDDSGVVIDAYLGDNQSYSSAHVSISGEDVVHAANAVDPQGYKIVGWWHSHARFSVFHSGTDVNNFETIVHAVGPNTLMTEYENIDINDIAKNGKVDLGGYLVDAELLKDADIKKKNTYSWAYSLVVNVMGDVYTEVQTKELKPDNEWELKNPIKSAGYDLHEAENDLTIDAKVLEDEVYDKLNVRRYVPVEKFTKRKAATTSRRWSLFTLADYIVGWFYGDNKKKDVVDDIEKKVDEGVEKFKERKKKEHEKQKEKERLEEIEQQREECVEIANNFLDAAKQYVDKKKAPQKFWLDNVVAEYMQKSDYTLEQAIAAVNSPNIYSKLNIGKKKHRPKFVPKFVEELMDSLELCDIAYAFIEAESMKDQTSALERLKKTYSETKKEDKTPEEPEAKKIAEEIPVKVVKPEDDALLDLVKQDLSKENDDIGMLADRFISGFADYVNVSYNTPKKYKYNRWAYDTLTDFRNRTSASFMHLGQENNRNTFTYMYNGYYGNLSWRKDSLVKRATQDLLKDPEFQRFAKDFLYNKDKDSVIEKYFLKRKKKNTAQKAGRADNIMVEVDPVRAYPPGALDAPLIDQHTASTGFKVSNYVKRSEPDFEPDDEQLARISQRVYNNMFDGFFKQAKDYMFNNGEYAAWLGQFLVNIAGDEGSIQKPEKEQQLNEEVKKALEEDSIEKKIKKRFNWYADGKPSASEIKDRLFLEFIADFKPENIPSFYEQMATFSHDEMLSKIFSEVITEYTMEGWGFDNQPVTKKYCSWTGKLLEDMIRPEKYVSLDGAFTKAGELRDDLLWSTDNFYTNKDRAMISNQVLLDLTYIVDPGKKQLLTDFMLDFISAYKSEAEDPDEIIEKFMKKMNEVKSDAGSE